jgi:caa(3)-type oxidase subunit IV
MSEPSTSAPAAPAAHGDSPGGHGHTNYVKIWGILCVLLVISVAGPFLGIRLVTLITAFGIAIVKAYMVCRYFMHINLEKKYVAYLVGSMVVLMVLMVGAVSPDVMKHEGANWHNKAAADWVDKGLKEAPAEEGEGGHEGGAHKGAPAPEHH